MRGDLGFLCPQVTVVVRVWSRSLAAPARPTVEVDRFASQRGAALAAGQLVDVAVRRTKMAPASTPLVHLPSE